MDERIITMNGLGFCAIAAFLVLIVLWAAASAIFPDEPNGFYGRRSALKFYNETRVRECEGDESKNNCARCQ